MINFYKYILHLGASARFSEKDQKKIRLLNLICMAELLLCLGLVVGGVLFDKWHWNVAAALFAVFAILTIIIQGRGKFALAIAAWLISAYVTLFTLIILFGQSSGAEYVLMIMPVLGSLFYEKKKSRIIFSLIGVFSLLFCFVFYAKIDPVFSIYHTVWDNLASTFSMSAVIFAAFIFFRSQLAASEAFIQKQTHSLLSEMTAKNRQQQLILEKENYISTILTHTPIMLIALDPEGKVRFCEGNILKKLELPEERSSQERIDLLRSSNADFNKNITAVLLGNKHEFQLEIGDMFLQFSFNPVMKDAAEMDYSIGICMDISDVKRAEKALAQKEAQHRQVLENAFDGIFVFDTRSIKPIACNRRTLELFKCTEEEFLNVSFTDVMPEYQPDGKHSYQRLAQYTQQVYKEGRVRFEWLNHDFNKVPFRSECSLAVLPRPFKHLVVIVIKDISKQKEAEFRREEAMKKLKEVNAELGQFAYVVSHDLKAPLRSISSLSGWIKDDYVDNLDSKGREMLDLLISRTERMHNLIEGVLTYSRVGRDNEQKVSIDLLPAIEQIIDSLDPPDHIQIKIETEMPRVYMERTRMGQLFQNLLSNAIKFMDKEEGFIQLGCVDEGTNWHFYIKDNGPGIEEAYFHKIFQIFQTLEARDKVESTGVGLTIVKKVVDLYKGKIEVESEWGSGSTFHIYLPKVALEASKNETHIKV